MSDTPIDESSKDECSGASSSEHSVKADSVGEGSSKDDGSTPDVATYLAYVRHEFRTPISAIIGYSEMLLEEAEDRGEKQLVEDLDQIRLAGRQALDSVNTILDASRIQSMSDLNLGSFCSHINQSLRAPVTTVIGYSEMLIDDAADSEVLTNATGDLKKIRLSAGKLLLILAELAAGSITLPGIGATGEELLEKESGHCGGHSEMEEGPDGHSGRLLVVDDNEMNRDMLSRRLERHGYGVASAAGGEEALVLLHKEPYDLVLLDLMMPGLNGDQVLSQIKADPDLRHIPVIMLSAFDDMASVIPCIEMGAEDYLAKPFDAVLLSARIGACLEKKHLRDREIALFQELQERHFRLQKLEKLRDDLTNMIVHDLRTPLTSLLTGLQTVDLLGDLNQDQKEIMSMAVQGGQTLLRMINDLLDISKMENGSLKLQYSSLDARRIMENATQQVMHSAIDNGLDFIVDLPSDLPPFVGDAEKLVRTLVNLTGNAIKFTPTGGKVTVSARITSDEKDGPCIEFSVADTGEGIPAEAFDRIFEKFGQVETRKSGRKMSTGLGLTFCKMVCEEHGGRIWVESELGKGSNFLFRIPLRQSVPKASASSA